VKFSRQIVTNQTTGSFEAEPCSECPEGVVAKVQVAQKFNDTYMEYNCQGGITVKIDHGVIAVTGLSVSPATAFLACGSATCSSISVKGVDLEALKLKATEHDFNDSAGASRSRRNCICCGQGDWMMYTAKPD